MRSSIETQPKTKPKFSTIKLTAITFTVLGVALFAYFVYAIGFWEIVDGISRFGIVGFAVILSIYFARICARALAWKLSVHSPSNLRITDTIPAVIIGEALSSTLPLGILISGTSKAVAVRSRIPLVSGLSSVATENLFYSFITGLFLISGAALLLLGFAVDAGIAFTLNLMIAVLVVATLLGIAMVVRQWHFASWLCEFVYSKGLLVRVLENGRRHVRSFEDLIYGFYRRHPHRFVPICLLEVGYHALGVCEGWFILSRLSESLPSVQSAFLLETISRLVFIVFKMVPFMIGVDEAGAQFVGQAVALTAGMGVTLAIIRKGRILFWTGVGAALIVKRGLVLSELVRNRSTDR